MKVARILGSQSRFYDRKCFAGDASMLSTPPSQNWTMTAADSAVSDTGSVTQPGKLALHFNSSADLVHGYGAVPPAFLRSLTIPFFSETPLSPRRWGWWTRREESVDAISRRPSVPEAVAESFFRDLPPASPRPGQRLRIGSLGGGRDLKRMIELSIVRFSRFRDDIDWDLFDEPPEPAIFDELSLWVDPTVEEFDRDGFAAEALVAGIPVVASANRINTERLQEGRCGFLVPPGDPNELVHAALTALFKSEEAAPRLQAARLSRDRFRGSNRQAGLQQLYGGIVT